MAVMKLVVTATTIEFDPQRGYRKPRAKRITRNRAQSGKIFSYKFFIKRKYEVPVAWFNKTDADQINLWWEDDEDVTFFPDLINIPGTSVLCKIINDEAPFPEFSGVDWETFFQGQIILEEIG